MGIDVFSKLAGVIKYLTTHVALVCPVTVLFYMPVLQPKIVNSQPTKYTLEQSLLVSMLVINVDRQGFLVEAHLVTVLTAYTSFYLRSINWVFPFLLWLVGTGWLLIRADFPLLTVLIPTCLFLA